MPKATKRLEQPDNAEEPSDPKNPKEHGWEGEGYGGGGVVVEKSSDDESELETVPRAAEVA